MIHKPGNSCDRWPKTVSSCHQLSGLMLAVVAKPPGKWSHHSQHGPTNLLSLSFHTPLSICQLKKFLQLPARRSRGLVGLVFFSFLFRKSFGDIRHTPDEVGGNRNGSWMYFFNLFTVVRSIQYIDGKTLKLWRYRCGRFMQWFCKCDGAEKTISLVNSSLNCGAKDPLILFDCD